MSSRRTLILIGAIAVGAIAAFTLLSWSRGVRQDAKPNPVDVYVVSAPIARGTSFADAKSVIKKKTIPAEFRPDTYVSDLKALDGKVAVTALAANQVLVQGMFVSSEVATTSMKNELGDGMVAISLPIDGVRAVGGLLQPGDEVNILVTVGGKADAAAATPGGGSTAVNLQATPYTHSARYLYEKARILAIGNQVRALPGAAVSTDTKTAASNTLPTSSGSVTFEVPPEVAQRLASVDPTTFYLTLIPSSWQPKAIAPLQPNDLAGLLPAEDPNGQLTPYGPKGYAGLTGTGKGN